MLGANFGVFVIMKSRNKIYTITQAAELCHLNRITLWRWIKLGNLQAYQAPSGHYKIKEEDIERFAREKLKYIEPIFKEKSPRILIIDDDEAVRKLIKQILLKEDYCEIDEASTGLEAGLKIMKIKPSLIILDLHMPEIDGFEVCRHVKSDSATQHIKIIAISGYGSPGNREKIKDLGADIFLEKPINKQDLLHSIKQLLES
jgi:excisionase family DNA binding protein